jgi:LytS/YehU family sensor histidine kinase
MDDVWQATDLHSRSFERLRVGSYTFELEAINAIGIPGSERLIMEIQVYPVWYEQKRLWFLGIIALVASVIYFYNKFIQSRYQRRQRIENQKRLITDLELKALKAQINPHFIFNTLNAIQYFISINAGDKADYYMQLLSKMLRTTLEYSDKMTINLTEELDYLRSYIEMESIRFDNDFYYEIKVENPLLESYSIPTMVLQPLVENSIRHGLKPLYNKEKKLRLVVSESPTEIHILIADNGVGRDHSAGSSSLNKVSYGQQLSESKLLFFSEATGRSASIHIADEPGWTKTILNIQK